MKLISPYRFRERELLIGGGGAGKTTAALSQIQACAVGRMFVLDNDYSQAWNRAIDIDFPDLYERVLVNEIEPLWTPFVERLESLVGSQINDADNWLVIDSISPTWDFVQNWYVELAMSSDIGAHMAALRKDFPNAKEYGSALAESMNWPAIKKEYAKVYRAIQQWKGHLILTAEAKSLKGERDEAVAKLYGPVGMKPVGEGRLHHVTSTTLFLTQTASGYKFSTVKDRNRQVVQNERVEALADGGFAMSYLREIAGWTIQRKARVAT